MRRAHRDRISFVPQDKRNDMVGGGPIIRRSASGGDSKSRSLTIITQRQRAGFGMTAKPNSEQRVTHRHRAKAARWVRDE